MRSCWGSPIVLRDFPVGEFADSGYPRAGAFWKTDDGVTLTFIGPSLPFIESNNTINDNSIAFIMRYKHFRILFTGDAGVAAEQRFLSEGIDLRADVLKVGHHGSAYSSMETLAEYGARIYRTDDNGAVSITTDGSSIAIRSMLEPLLAPVLR